MTLRIKVWLMHRWAKEFGLTIVKIKAIGNTEYLVCHDGALRKLSTKRTK